MSCRDSLHGNFEKAVDYNTMKESDDLRVKYRWKSKTSTSFRVATFVD